MGTHRPNATTVFLVALAILAAVAVAIAPFQYGGGDGGGGTGTKATPGMDFILAAGSLVGPALWARGR